ncbi:shufflon system plasmid conjugative transfer pilus tip adhesin PilV [Serratia symbiotica]|uniref:shufflon system plasmid conjugative transfer pilus tip adhesin PilV n=1 Tax=Serratia symbiotica TaxID=138074 RepID=UPI00136E26B2|nr:shufflon system plasmid conjugative transfer pilus tip adhesin PilV [Serratia symbiotica]QTP13359.1 shufflon system plasmid conjugative transfer pilus tip adhesin PilV [Serratia symbiotica]
MRNLKKLHEGFTLLEIIMGLAILAIASTSVMMYQQSQAEDDLNSVTAQYQSILTKASQKYISDNYDAVLAVATATTPAVITVPMLKTTKYLPASFGNVGPRGQTYQLYAIEPSSNKLESILVSSGGPTISDKNLVQIANKAGATAGYVLSSAPGTVKGVYGSWSTALSNYKIGNNAGHLASALFFTDGQVDNDYLYRSAVSGHPEVNRMNTAIDLNGNDLNNVNTTNTTTLKSTTTNTSAETYTGGWFRTTGDGGVYFSKYGGGWYMNNTSTISAYGNKNVQTAGGLYGGYVNSTGNIDASGNITGNGTVTGGSVYSRNNVQAAGNVLANGYLYSGLVAVANTGCPANGAVAREAAGGPLFCQSGVWKSTGADLKQDQCAKIGNFTGRDFTDYRCPLGWYAAGLQFVGHQHNESAYVITCCH